MPLVVLFESSHETTPVPEEIMQQLRGTPYNDKMIVTYQGQEWIVASSHGVSTELSGELLDWGDIIPQDFTFQRIKLVPIRFLELEE